MVSWWWVSTRIWSGEGSADVVSSFPVPWGARATGNQQIRGISFKITLITIHKSNMAMDNVPVLLHIYIYSHFVNYRWFSHSNHDRFQGLPLFANPGVPKQRRHPPPTPPQEFRAALQGAALRGSACRACTRFVQQKAGFGRNIVIPMDIHGIILG